LEGEGIVEAEGGEGEAAQLVLGRRARALHLCAVARRRRRKRRRRRRRRRSRQTHAEQAAAGVSERATRERWRADPEEERRG